MRIYFLLLFLTGMLFQSNAQTATNGNFVLPFNIKECFKYDETNWSPRKYLLDADAYDYQQRSGICDIDSFPEVDFTKHILLYVSYAYSGCERNVDRKMMYLFDDKNKKLLLYIIVFEKGICRPVIYATDLFPIPIVPKSFSIEIYKPGVKTPLIIPAEE